MTVYVDKAGNAFGRMIMCHMVADTLAELHTLADAIGLRREWFQGSASFPHYDVAKGRRAAALKLGAVEIERGDLAKFMRAKRADPAFISEWAMMRRTSLITEK